MWSESRDCKWAVPAPRLVYLDLDLTAQLQLIGVVFDQRQVGFRAGVDLLSWNTNTTAKHRQQHQHKHDLSSTIRGCMESVFTYAGWWTPFWMPCWPYPQTDSTGASCSRLFQPRTDLKGFAHSGKMCDIQGFTTKRSSFCRSDGSFQVLQQANQ